MILLFALLQLACIDRAHEEEIMNFQFELNAAYADSAHTPLLEEDQKTFKGHEFFPIDKSYRVEAILERTPNEASFEMETTTDRRPLYKQYGLAHFELNGKKQTLAIYQNLDLIKKRGFEKELFLPFGDQTNADESYGGGRFLDLKIPTGNTIILDFNKAYNPYCAYNPAYSCPIPPEQNRLTVSIKAGVKAPPHHH